MSIFKIIKPISIFVTAILTSGCLGFTNYVVPEKFSSATEVYPQKTITLTGKDLPSGSYKAASFEAPYEDVFRAVTESAGQALLNIESSDKNNGLILATKAIKVRNGFDSQINQAYEAERRYYFAMTIKEIGAETTNVMIISKVQTSCQFNNLFGDEVCEKEATVSYSTDFWHSSMDDMNNFIIFIRNNLYAAGIL